MNPIINALLQTGIAIASSDREQFIDKLAQSIQTKMDLTPENTDKIGDNILSALEGLKHYLDADRLAQAVKSQQIDANVMKELIETLQELNTTLKNK